MRPAESIEACSNLLVNDVEPQRPPRLRLGVKQPKSDDDNEIGLVEEDCLATKMLRLAEMHLQYLLRKMRRLKTKMMMTSLGWSRMNTATRCLMMLSKGHLLMDMLKKLKRMMMMLVPMPTRQSCLRSCGLEQQHSNSDYERSSNNQLFD